MQSASVATHDPGGEVDYYAFLTSTVTHKEILITDAKAWRVKDYPDVDDFYGFVEGKISGYHQKYKFDYHICEKNNIGTTIINSLRFKYKIPVTPIVTSNNVTNQDTLRSGKAYNKNETVVWVNRLRAAGIIKMPRTMTPGLKLMNEQLDNFGAKLKNGRTVYEALQGNDDFVTCLDILVNFAMRKFLKLPELKKTILSSAGITDQQFYGTQTKSMADIARDTLSKRGITPDDLSVSNKW